MPKLPQRISREEQTMAAMMRIYCEAHHDMQGEFCGECSELLQYAGGRLRRCPLAANKPTCAKCTIHCYKSDMREKVRAVMRYSGPRMILRHPILAVLHLFDGFRTGGNTATDATGKHR
jgi:hypothetical protein